MRRSFLRTSGSPQAPAIVETPAHYAPTLFCRLTPLSEVVNAVAEQAEDDAVLVTDVGQNQLFATRYFKYHHKRSICTIFR